MARTKKSLLNRANKMAQKPHKGEVGIQELLKRIEMGEIKSEADVREDLKPLYILVRDIPNLVNQGAARESILQKYSNKPFLFDKSYIASVYDRIFDLIGDRIISGNSNFFVGNLSVLANQMEIIIQKMMSNGDNQNAINAIKVKRDLILDMIKINHEQKAKLENQSQMPEAPQISEE